MRALYAAPFDLSTIPIRPTDSERAVWIAAKLAWIRKARANGLIRISQAHEWHLLDAIAYWGLP